ncbi:hypothetical protein KIN20_016828, partial [Parelaphostrongylus tenuis]
MEKYAHNLPPLATRMLIKSSKYDHSPLSCCFYKGECGLIGCVKVKRCVTARNLRHIPSGVACDPKGMDLVTMSTDRKMDLIDVMRSTRLLMFEVSALPAVTILDVSLEQK